MTSHQSSEDLLQPGHIVKERHQRPYWRLYENRFYAVFDSLLNGKVRLLQLNL
jgi:hypothetical protein